MRWSLLSILCLLMMSLPASSTQFDSVQAKAQDSDVTFELTFDIRTAAIGRGPMFVNPGEPKNVPFTLSYVSVADFENAKKQAAEKKGRPEDFAKWKQVLTNSVKLRFGDYYFRIERTGSVSIMGPTRIENDCKITLTLP